MPELTLRFWDHSVLRRVDAFEVEDVMLFPHDRDKSQHYALDWFETELDTGVKALLRDHVLLPTDDSDALQRLLNHKTATRRQPHEIKRAYDQGCVAGQIGAMVWLAPRQQSIRKAEYAMVETNTSGRTRNRDYIRKAWQTYKPVAHLWSAMTAHSSTQSLADLAPETAFQFFLRENLLSKLSLAEEIRRSLPQMDTGPWTVPERVKLPHGAAVGMLPIALSLQDALFTYKPDPNRR